MVAGLTRIRSPHQTPARKSRTYPRSLEPAYNAGVRSNEGRCHETSLQRDRMRRLRAGFVTPHSGGSGTPVGRHQDRSAGSLLDWDRTPMSTSQETRPGAEPPTPCGAWREPRWSARRRASPALGRPRRPASARYASYGGLKSAEARQREGGKAWNLRMRHLALRPLFPKKGNEMKAAAAPQVRGR